MFNRTRPTFNVEEIGYISQGPTQRLCVSLVNFLDNTSHLKWYCDIRYRVLSSKGDRKWWPTQRGVTLPTKVVVGINNALVNLPVDCPALGPREVKTIAMVEKYKNMSICLSLVDYENNTQIDIREYTKNGERGYEGFTNKGVRARYSTGKDLSSLLICCLNKMIDLEQKNIKKDIEEKKKVS